MDDERITIDRYGLDEIVLANVDVHVERMNHNQVWFALYRGSKRLSVFLTAEGNDIRGFIQANELGLPETPKEHWT